MPGSIYRDTPFNEARDPEHDKTDMARSIYDRDHDVRNVNPKYAVPISSHKPGRNDDRELSDTSDDEDDDFKSPALDEYFKQDYHSVSAKAKVSHEEPVYFKLKINQKGRYYITV